MTAMAVSTALKTWRPGDPLAALATWQGKLKEREGEGNEDEKIGIGGGRKKNTAEGKVDIYLFT